ncbi:MAG: hypothetical protein O7A04_05745 [Acidobacteria bacterium]|nr:hypothetical protein [Acidobacteriota bacterium]
MSSTRFVLLLLVVSLGFSAGPSAFASESARAVVAVLDQRSDLDATSTDLDLAWVAGKTIRYLERERNLLAELIEGSSSQGRAGLIRWLAEEPAELRFLVEVHELTVDWRHQPRPQRGLPPQSSPGSLNRPQRVLHLDLSLTVVDASGRILAVSRAAGAWPSVGSPDAATSHRAVKATLEQLLTAEPVSASLARHDRLALLETPTSATGR